MILKRFQDIKPIMKTRKNGINSFMKSLIKAIQIFICFTHTMVWQNSNFAVVFAYYTLKIDDLRSQGREMYNKPQNK